MGRVERHRLNPFVGTHAVTLTLLVLALVLIAVRVDGFTLAVLKGSIPILLLALIDVLLRNERNWVRKSTL